MRTRPKLILATGALALLGICFLLLPSSEPRYEGRTLSFWLSTISGFHGGEAHAYAQRAIIGIGTNGLPYLLRWMDYEPRPSKSKQWVAKATALSRIGYVKRWLAAPDKHQARAECCVFAFHVLGARGSNAVPELTRLALASGRPISASRAVNALMAIGPPGLGGLITVITNRGAAQRSTVIAYVGTIGTNALPALPSLGKCLLDTTDLSAAIAARTLGRLRLQPDFTVPALERALHDRRPDVRIEAAYALAEFGASARPAVAALRGVVLIDPDPAVRRQIEAAVEMIESIDGTPTQ